MSTYQHGEAYCLMTYRADDGSETEVVWNSRDGVTPFVISLRSGKPASHVNWHLDERMPEDWLPPPGMRVFVDLTEERARELALANARRFWNDPGYPASQTGRWASVEAMADDLARAYLEQPGQPDLVEAP